MKKCSRRNLRNIQTMIQDKTGVVIIPERTCNYRRVAAAAVFVLVAGIAGFPVRALVTGLIRERMENLLSQEEVQEMNDMVQAQRTEAAGFSRGYSLSEYERLRMFWKAYDGGKFPESVIAQVDNAEDATEEMLCYIRSTGVYNLPDREMTDEEILEIIDFQQMMSYAVSQSPAAQEARAHTQAVKEQWERIEAGGGISEEEAIEIATKQMEAEMEERAEGKEILRYDDGSVAVVKTDISWRTDYEHTRDVAYIVQFGNREDHSSYDCTIDAVDGSILHIEINEPTSKELHKYRFLR